MALAPAVLLALAAALRPVLWPAVVGLDAALLLAFLLDLAAVPAPARLVVLRNAPHAAGLAQDFARTVRVRLERAPALGRLARAGWPVELHEEFSARLEVRARSLEARRSPAGAAPGPPRPGDPSGGPDRGRLRPGRPLDLVRTYAAGRRGVATLGEVRLIVRGPLGLVERGARLAGEQQVAIHPALVGLRRTLALAASERWADLGVRRVRRAGARTEFESLREYVPGDDVRQVDWKAFARRGEPIVREFQEERGQELVLVVDCGRRMIATTSQGELRGWTKLDHALDAALQLAAVALQRGDRVGVLAFDAGTRAWVAPRRGARQLERLSEAVFALQPSELESDLARALRDIGARHRRSALLAVLSDVADPLSVDRQRRALRAGTRRHRILFAALDDPSVRRAALDPATDAPLRAAAAILDEDRRAALHRLAASGARVVDALPAEAAGPLLAAWLDLRRAQGR